MKISYAHPATACLYGLLLLSILSCKKEVEVIREIEKKNSWTESQRFSGTEKIFLSAGSNENTIFLQQPFFFTTFTHQNEYTGITTYGAGLPTDIGSRLPISPQFTAYAISDTSINIINNKSPFITPAGGYFNLKAIDPTLTSIQQTNTLLYKTMAIDSNGILLLHYSNNRPDAPLTFMMLSVKTYSGYPYIDTLSSNIITIPNNMGYGYARYFTAVDDYFLADLSASGLYKINEDGSHLKIHEPLAVGAFHKWQGKLYAYANGGKALISTDDGLHWQEYTGITSSMVSSEFYTIGDSLIGVTRDMIYTLTWNGSHYSQRALKNDGLESTAINGLEILHDTVYAATTGGLFFKPATAFFD